MANRPWWTDEGMTGRLDRIRRWRRLALMGFAGLIATRLAAELIPQLGEAWITRLYAIGAVLGFVPAIALWFAPCPRCRKPFFRRSGATKARVSGDGCVHCGLSLDTASKPEREALPDVRD